MGSSVSLYSLYLVSLFFFVSTRPTTDAEGTSSQNISQSSNSRVPNALAQKFIRDLYLSPQFAPNMIEDDPLVKASKIVEKSFRFPSISDYGTTNSTEITVQEFAHHAGYLGLNRTQGARIFYYFFESRNNNKTKAPVVVWLGGGPGTSGSLALFYENGPFHLTDNLSIVWNEYGWDKDSNLLFIDQPIGTGFSYYTNESDIPTTSEAAAVDFYDILQAFFEKHHELAMNDFYITGESYAGHFIPAFAARIQQGNKNRLGRHINLKGLLMISPWTFPGLQFQSYPPYALKMKLINQTQYNHMIKPFWLCWEQVKKACDGTDYNFTACAEANLDCNDILWDYIIKPMGNKNYYDIRKPCGNGPDGSPCYNFSNMERFLNQASVKRALGVNESIEFVTWSSTVNYAMAGDQMRNLAVYIPELLHDGIKLLVYSGDYDLICNWLGNIMWVGNMQWSGRKGFWRAPNGLLKVDGVRAGWLKRYGPLTFLKVNDAGHMVPMDQPKVALEVLRRWTNGIPM